MEDEWRVHNGLSSAQYLCASRAIDGLPLLHPMLESHMVGWPLYFLLHERFSNNEPHGCGAQLSPNIRAGLIDVNSL